MFDKLVLRIPFALEHASAVRFVRSPQGVEQLAGQVDPQRYECRLSADAVYRDEEGRVRVEGLRCPWDSVPSSFSKMAFKLFPMGNGFDPWPHVEIKASPAKLLQGHNVYGSEWLRPGLEEMLFLLSYAYPQLFADLDVKQARIAWLDCTLSAKFDNEALMRRVFDFLSLIADTQITGSSSPFPTLYWQKNSDYFSNKIYAKYFEVLNDIKTATAEKRFDRVEILKSVLSFAEFALRLEASIKRKKLELLGIPTNAFEFIKFEKWFFEVHGETVCRHLWNIAFNKLLSQLEGHTMPLVDDDLIKTQIFAALNTIDNSGKINQRLSRAVWNTFLNIKAHGFKFMQKQDSSTFYRHVSLLTSKCGLSKAFLKTYKGNASSPTVVPLVNVINVDFTQQRPADWVEPVPRTLRLVS